MRITAALLAVLPTLALAQGAPPKPPPPPAAGVEGAPAPGTQQERWARAEKRLRLARALGLAEALDLDQAQATRMNDQLKGFDARRKPVLERLRADVRSLRAAARDAKVTAQQVDEATGRIFAARGALLALDQEMLASLGKDLSPEKRARMALFFARFRARAGMELRDRMGEGGGGPGRGPGHMRGPPDGPPFPRGGPLPPGEFLDD